MISNIFLNRSLTEIGSSKWYSNLHYFRLFFIVDYLTKNKKEEKETALEIGVWPGYLALALSLANFEVSGIDLNPERISKTGYLKNLWTYDLNAKQLALPCQNDCFNYVIISEVIEHINPQNLPALFSEIKRVLKPGGAAIITTPNKDSLHNKLSMKNNPIKQTNGHGHVHEYTKKELNEIVNQSKLKILESRSINFYDNIGTLPKGEYFYPLRNFLQYPNKLFNIVKLFSWPIKQIPALRDSLFIAAQK